ncbi:hypothetical protein PC117_g10407 [Phytophthora cactorum]|uniref:Uncharacterized protein n=1 Tax=Phytophthora cactorum TaxID=29920 RepID=A0A8T1DIE1_9STRA|nr:hypothetical protein PC117_g10407 [Phytophthora cactorum]
MTPEQLALVYPDAPHRGNKFIFLFMVANLGAVIAYGPTYGIFIELSQREPEHIRGRLQTNVFMVRNALASVTAFLTGLCLNSTEYGGTFSWTIGFNGIIEGGADQVHRYLYKEIYEIIQKEPFYRLFIFRYFTKIFAAVSVTASSNIQSIYAGVTPLNDGIAACISQILIVAGILSIKTWGLQWNWQYLAIFSQLSAVFVDAFPTYFTIWHVFRSQWFWLGVPLLEEFVGEFVDYATTVTMVQIAEPGREAMSMGFFGSITAAAQQSSPSRSTATSRSAKRLSRETTMPFTWTSPMPHTARVALSRHRGRRSHRLPLITQGSVVVSSSHGLAYFMAC